MRDALLLLLERIALLLASGVAPWRALTPEEARAILEAYDAGTLTDEDLARLLPAPALRASVTEDALALALYRLHVAAGLSASAARAASLGGVVRVVDTTGLGALIRVTEGFEERTFRLSRSLQRGGLTVSQWQTAALREIRSEVLGSAALGYGREPTPAEAARLQAALDREAAYLSRFADEVAARRLLAEVTGDPSLAFTERYVQQRLAQYGSEGRASFFEAVESRKGEGWVVDYEARDDGGTCETCRENEQGGPYLPGQGPMPARDCRARNRCRCRRVARWSPSDYRRLTNESDA